MITQYEIVVAREDESLFITAVNELINDGWQPYGDASVVVIKGKLVFSQPLVKEMQPEVKVKRGAY